MRDDFYTRGASQFAYTAPMLLRIDVKHSIPQDRPAHPGVEPLEEATWMRVWIVHCHDQWNSGERQRRGECHRPGITFPGQHMDDLWPETSQR